MMGRRWLQNKVAESRLTLPVSVALFIVVRLFQGVGVSLTAAAATLLCLCTAAVMLETNVALQILRVRSRLGESLWLLLAAAMPFLYGLSAPAVCAFCLAAGMGLLLCCYQNRNAVLLVFHSFLFLGAGSLLSPVMIPLALLFYFCLAFLMRAFSWKGLWAGIVGLLTPYWCWVAWEACVGDVMRVADHVLALWLWVLDWDGLSLLPAVRLLPVWCLLVFFGLTGIIHYMRKRYDDKIRTRMMLYVYVCVTVFLHVAFLLLPGQRMELLAMMAVSTSPLMAHYWAMTRGRVGWIVLMVSLVGWLAVLALASLAV